jgi:hypothetical protein
LKNYRKAAIPSSVLLHKTPLLDTRRRIFRDDRKLDRFPHKPALAPYIEVKAKTNGWIAGNEFLESTIYAREVPGHREGDLIKCKSYTGCNLWAVYVIIRGRAFVGEPLALEQAPGKQDWSVFHETKSAGLNRFRVLK